MKKNIRTKIVSFAFALILAIVSPANTEAKINGGEVQTNGVITFYEESSSKESSEPTEPASTRDSSTNESKVVKPTGRYPSTGEMVKVSFVFTGIVLVGIGFLLFLWKHRKKQEGWDDR